MKYKEIPSPKTSSSILNHSKIQSRYHGIFVVYSKYNAKKNLWHICRLFKFICQWFCKSIFQDMAFYWLILMQKIYFFLCILAMSCPIVLEMCFVLISDCQCVVVCTLPRLIIYLSIAKSHSNHNDVKTNKRTAKCSL
jgi:hypothetical protein